MKKNCTGCGGLKPLADFQIRRASKDGLTARCKACLAEYDAKRYQEQPKRRAHALACSKTLSGLSARKKWASRNPKKRKAHIALGNAIRDGKITKPDQCEECGKSGCLHGHHEDYSKPLSVIWVCPACHRLKHK